jgi:glycosyltransferase involved in cell wall biosynthesis
MRVRTVDSVPELQAHLAFPRPGVVVDADLDLLERNDEAPESRRRDAEILATLAANSSGDCLDLRPPPVTSTAQLTTNLGKRGRVLTREEGTETGSVAICILDLSDPPDPNELSADLTIWCGFDPAAPPTLPAKLQSATTQWLHVRGSNLLIGCPETVTAGDWPVGIPLRSQRPGSARGQVSVVMPNYNHGAYITEAIEAVMRQSIAPVEVLVMEHGSTDNSPETLERLADQYPSLRWNTYSRNRHFMQHVNDLAGEALGEFLYFAAADDFALPGLFERSLSVLTQHPKAGFSAAPVRLADRNSQLLDLYPAPAPTNEPAFITPDQNLNLLQANLGGWAMGNASLMRRSVMFEAGPFDMSLGSFCDGFLRMAIGQLWGACYVPEPLATWRKLDDGYASSTEQDERKLLACYQRACELMNTRYAGWFPADFTEYFTSRLIITLEQRLSPESCAPSPVS